LSPSRCLCGTALALSLLFAGADARACSPSNAFTPVHLVEQSQHILDLRLGEIRNGKLPVIVVTRLKGDLHVQRVTIDLFGAHKEQIKAAKYLLGGKGRDPALLFIGPYGVDLAEAPAGLDAKEIAIALLHCRGRWLRLLRRTDDRLEFERVDDGLGAVWHGDTGMLRRCIQYVVEDADPTVPTGSGAHWAEPVRVGTVGGRAHELHRVRLRGSPGFVLHLAASSGDRLWEVRTVDGEPRFHEIAARRKLDTASRLAAWADFNGDGRLDLASWDGRRFAFALQQTDGTFRTETRKPDAPLRSVISLSVTTAPTGRAAALLAGAPEGPALLTRAGDGSLHVRPLGEKPGATLGEPGPCLVADLDDDGFNDVLHLFEKGSMLYQGSGRAAFRPGTRLAVAFGGSNGSATLGDYDADGRLDLFTVSRSGFQLWHNLGGGRFADLAQGCGEASHLIRCDGGTRGGTCDFNNDGRQDLAVFYADQAPQLFYNRGFANLSHAHAVDLAEHKLVPAAAKGTQTGLVADLDGDGAQDLALVAKNGEIWVCWNDSLARDQVAAARVTLPGTAQGAGPVRVTGWDGKRCLGAWTLWAGHPGQLIAAPEPTRLTLRWRFPGGRERRRTIDAHGPIVEFPIPTDRPR